MAQQAQEQGDSISSEQVRLQRFLAAAGLGSRRDCEKLILEGRVEVDGKICTELGTKINSNGQQVLVDGERVRGQKLQYFMLNKPMGVLSTNVDPSGRVRVIDLIKTDLRVFNVGRLDQSSEGLIIVTNDGDLTFRLTHPKFGVEKTYQVQVVGCPTPEQLEQLEQGVHLAEGKAKAERVVFKKRNRTGSILEMVLAEGRNREIRRLFARIGHKVTRLKRIAVGPLQLGDLPVGAHRKLTLEEISTLKKVASSSASKRSTARPTRPAKKPFAKQGPKSLTAHGSKRARSDRNELGRHENKPFQSRTGGSKPFATTQRDGGTRPFGSTRPGGRPKRKGVFEPIKRSSEGASQRGSQQESPPRNRKGLDRSRNKFRNEKRNGDRTQSGGKPFQKSSGRRGAGRFQRKPKG